MTTRVIFNGYSYSVYAGSRYFRCNRQKPTKRKPAGKKSTYLHRDVWESVYGKIPTGQDVHHVDGNRDNNSISNLELINHKDHGKHHGDESKEGFKVWLTNGGMELQKKLSLDWWIENTNEFTCKRKSCGKVFRRYKAGSKSSYCSINCKKRKHLKKWEHLKIGRTRKT